ADAATTRTNGHGPGTGGTIESLSFPQLATTPVERKSTDTGMTTQAGARLRPLKSGQRDFSSSFVRGWTRPEQRLSSPTSETGSMKLMDVPTLACIERQAT